MEQSVVKMLSKRLICLKTPFCICPRKRKSPKFRAFLWLRGKDPVPQYRSVCRSCMGINHLNTHNPLPILRRVDHVHHGLIGGKDAVGRVIVLI